MDLNEPLEITTTRIQGFPVQANFIFDNISPGNCEDVIWQNLIDTKSEIEQTNIGASITQTYQYTKLHDTHIILTKWQGMHTSNGSEFRIGLGTGIVGDKNTPPIMSGNFKTGVQVNSTLNIEAVKLGCVNGDFAVEVENKWYRVQLGEELKHE
tara:strand:- start:395 stop:856 length:462 start_codon:yes stop_codon:yes gene_type:complete